MTQLLMTRAEFAQWVVDHGIRVLVPPPYRVQRCPCRDVTCHGWRFVSEPVAPRELTYVAEQEPA